MSSRSNLRSAAILFFLSLALAGCSGTSQSAVLSSISPASITVGSAPVMLTVLGTGFTSDTVVYVGDTAVSPSTVTGTMMTVWVPAATVAAAKSLPVTVAGSAQSCSFTINNPPPVLTSLSLTSVGTNSGDFVLTVQGTQFVADTKLDFGGMMLTPSAVNTPNSLTVTVPAAAIAKGGMVAVRVNSRGPGGGDSNSLDFTVLNPLPEVVSLSAASVIAGSSDFTLEISGSNFVSDTTVAFGPLVLTPTAWTATRLTATVPASAIARAGVLSLSVASPSPGGGGSNELPFTVANPVPSMDRLSPPSVTAGGTDVTLAVTGSGFVPDSVATREGTQLSTTFVSSDQINVVVPALAIAQAGAVNLTVTNPGPGGGDSNLFVLAVRARAPLSWDKVVNGNDPIPNSSQVFNSYSQPAVNSTGLVVFKGQGKGGGGNSADPRRGIYTRRVSGNAPITMAADEATLIPQPNNTLYNGEGVTYTEFPSIPRIDATSDTVVFRGQHQPVYTYTLPDGTETRIGSAGLYANPANTLLTAVGLMGLVPEYSHFQVPGAAPGTRFDQFPGSPAITDGSVVVFKGNYTEAGVSKTGVYYRDLVKNGGASPVEVIANAGTVIPNQPAGGTVTFGSTAPPSAVNGNAVFTAWDNEENPTLAGIYLAPIQPGPPLQTLVGLETQVPGEAPGTTFKQLGESLSYDGRFVAFWGAWGEDMNPVFLACATDGNTDMLASCNAMYPNGFATQVRVHQGIFVYDTFAAQLIAVAKSPTDFDDFVYWTFSGRPPGSHGGTGEDVVPEPPRWRSSSFMAVSGQGNAEFTIAFKAHLGPIDGIYLAQGPDAATIQTVLDTRMLGTEVDGQAPPAAIIATLGLERDSFRGSWLVIAASMLDPATSEGLGGIYITHAPPPGFGLPSGGQ